ncbi:hypothetical protein [Tahibacter caeni]|uniref:hypothetical protein n=1 Tax=Tahibacter caeni TaxID=1453545 RepID=UPI0021475B75|nr:hypothetical protein [Tahibacter caeni]
MRTRLAIAVLSILAALPAAAAVKQSAPEGFIVEHRLSIAATPAQAWATLGQPARWWPKEHTWSGNPANLSLSLTLGGCFCERWPDGGAEHGRIIMLRRNELVRLNAALGPLQDMAVTGVLSIAIAPKDEGSEAIVTYRVSGTPAHALDKIAIAVDQVVGLQFGGWAALDAAAVDKPAVKKKP